MVGEQKQLYLTFHYVQLSCRNNNKARRFYLLLLLLLLSLLLLIIVLVLIQLLWRKTGCKYSSCIADFSVHNHRFQWLYMF